jgi:hypothetical protein
MIQAHLMGLMMTNARLTRHSLQKTWCQPLKIWALIAALGLANCTPDQDQHSQNKQSNAQKPSKPTYQPHPAYAPSTGDPLKALYGGQDPNTGGRGLSPQALKLKLNEIKDQPLTSPLPKTWRRPLQKLKAKLNAKVSSWTYLERTRMERGKRDRSIHVTLKVWGKKKRVNRDVLSALKEIKALKRLPNSWGDQHEFVIKNTHSEVVSKRSASLANDHPTNPTVLATFEIKWEINHPQPTGDLKNCRYVHGLSPDIARGFSRWVV